MKRIITLVVIMLAMVSVAMGQKTSKEIDNMFYNYRVNFGKIEKVYGKGGRFMFDVGDYTFKRNHILEDKYDVIFCDGIQKYIVECNPAEGEALTEHFERNRQYYDDKYGFTILDFDYDYIANRFTLKVFFLDWDKLQKEAEAKKKAAEQKKIESISW